MDGWFLAEVGPAGFERLSTSGRCAYRGDPAGRPGCAASVRWALEAWRAAAHDADVLSTPYLANAYYATRADALSACWRTAKGPIAVAHLELRRIGWPRTTPFEFTDAEGNTYRLLHVSPNTIRHLLHRAALTHLAQQLARAPDQRRVLLGHVVKMLRSNTFSARQKGIIATVFAGGICARDCLRDAGYNAPPECELCGPTHGHTDSVHHRIWVCLHPDATAARDCASCAPALLRDARVSDPRDPHNVFVTGRGTADPYDWPTPTEHFEHVFQLSSPDGTLHAVPLAQ